MGLRIFDMAQNRCFWVFLKSSGVEGLTWMLPEAWRTYWELVTDRFRPFQCETRCNKEGNPVDHNCAATFRVRKDQFVYTRHDRHGVYTTAHTGVHCVYTPLALVCTPRQAAYTPLAEQSNSRVYTTTVP